MKKNLLFKCIMSWMLVSVLVHSAPLTYAQSPQAFKYQSIVRNASGDPMSNAAITVRVTIHQDNSSGNSIYQELHSVSTNSFGLINLEIGNGIVESGNFSTIDWGHLSKWVEIAADFGNGYVPMGVSQLLSVPFSLYSLNGISGPTGATGSVGGTGPQGIVGASGIQGDTGLQGITGNTGALGSQGNTGNQGVQGNVGASGIQGDTGLQGITGNTGAIGSQGNTGNQGVQGNVGASGIQGDNGLQGITGNTGAIGSQGNTGNQGIQGNVGASGIQGDAGLQGNTGNTGAIGSQGNTGNQGIQGNVGASGIQGDTGLQGTTGAQGSSGIQGDTGIQGVTGLNGVTGDTGPAGSSAADAWLLNGSTNGIIKSIGTLDNFDFNILTNGIEAARFTADKRLFIGDVASNNGSGAGVQSSSLTANRSQYRCNQYGANNSTGGLSTFKSRGLVIGAPLSAGDGVLVGDVIQSLSGVGVTGSGLLIPIAYLQQVVVAQVTPGSVACDWEISLCPKNGVTNSRRKSFAISSEGIQRVRESASVPVGTGFTAGLVTLDASGSILVSNTNVFANTRFLLTMQDGGTIPSGNVFISSRTVGTDFTIKSNAGVADAGLIVYYQLYEPLP